ncbi:hypothetical protein RZE82_08505 [Mollicutes bacterium LVI A0039]|nr:hypothetical protein RZE82_08505 [Mollicutes bacterium LVI A0039]
MNEKLQILKDSIDAIINSETFLKYQQKQQTLNADAQFQMYKFVVNNKDKFSTDTYNRAKLKYVKCESILSQERLELDQAFNQIIELYHKY